MRKNEKGEMRDKMAHVKNANKAQTEVLNWCQVLIHKTKGGIKEMKKTRKAIRWY